MSAVKPNESVHFQICASLIFYFDEYSLRIYSGRLEDMVFCVLSQDQPMSCGRSCMAWLFIFRSRHSGHRITLNCHVKMETGVESNKLV